jgi:hypothetical protein
MNCSPLAVATHAMMRKMFGNMARNPFPHIPSSSRGSEDPHLVAMDQKRCKDGLVNQAPPLQPPIP